MKKDLFGFKCRDKITGFEGHITGWACYITGCEQVLIQPKVKENGDFVEARWIDVDRIGILPGVENIVLDAKVNGPDKEAPRR